MPNAGEISPFNSDFQRFCGVSSYICTAFGLMAECDSKAGAGRANPFPVLFIPFSSINEHVRP